PCDRLLETGLAPCPTVEALRLHLGEEPGDDCERGDERHDLTLRFGVRQGSRARASRMPPPARPRARRDPPAGPFFSGSARGPISPGCKGLGEGRKKVRSA